MKKNIQSVALLGWNDSTVECLRELLQNSLKPKIIIIPENFDSRKLIFLGKKANIKIIKSVYKRSLIPYLSDCDIIVSASWPFIIRNEVLRMFPGRVLNVHASLLPKYRGSAPVNYAILNGDKQTGISIIRMVERMDAGPILKQVVVEIRDDETAEALDGRLAVESAGVVQSLLDDIESKTTNEIMQDETRVTFAPKLKKADGEINWSRPAREIISLINAMQPWPGAYTYYNSAGKEPLKVDILDAGLCEWGDNTLTESKAGDIIEITNNELIIYCGVVTPACRSGRESRPERRGGGAERLSIMSVKPAGSRVLTVREFINGYRLKTGDSFGKEVK